MKYEQFEEPIQIPQFFFTRDMKDLCDAFLTTDEERGQFLQLITTWALDNVMDVEYAKTVTPNVVDVVNRAIAMMYTGLNKYRWDYYNGSKGGRPKGIPKF